jgi:hypothetical protein
MKRQIVALLSVCALPLVLVDGPPLWACVCRELQGPARQKKEEEEDACVPR